MRLPLLTTVALLVLAPAADASILKFDATQNKVSYEAASGEVNRITATLEGSVVRLHDAGATIDVQKSDACRLVTPNEATCSVPNDKNVVKIQTGDLDDHVTYSGTQTAQLEGEEGNDVLTGGEGPDKLAGANGNDILNGRGGNDAFDGGEGDDEIRARDGVGETVLCGGGNDAGEADAEDGLESSCERVDQALFTPAIGETTPGGDEPTSGTISEFGAGPGVVDADDLVTADAAALATLPDPVPGESVSAAVGGGTVLVRRPGAKSFTRLVPARPVRTGSLVDARRGSVTIVAAKDLAGATQHATFTGGIFRVTQRRTARAMTTVLSLRGTLACGSRRTTARTAAVTRSTRRVRRLWGSGHGRFTTRGRNSTATVRGTIWGVTDRCDGTLTEVKRGVVAVKDLRTKKTRLVRAGGRYLVRNRA